MYGFNTVSLDQKGRLAIPAKYRTSFIQKNETQIVITKESKRDVYKQLLELH